VGQLYLYWWTGGIKFRKFRVTTSSADNWGASTTLFRASATQSISSRSLQKVLDLNSGAHTGGGIWSTKVIQTLY